MSYNVPDHERLGQFESYSSREGPVITGGGGRSPEKPEPKTESERLEEKCLMTGCLTGLVSSVLVPASYIYATHGREYDSNRESMILGLLPISLFVGNWIGHWVRYFAAKGINYIKKSLRFTTA